MDPRIGAKTVLTHGEKSALIDDLVRVGRHQSTLGMFELVKAGVMLYPDCSSVP